MKVTTETQPRTSPDLQLPTHKDDNRIVPSVSFYQAPEPAVPFRPGALVIATLANPREKIWGAILNLSPSGLSLRGVDLSSFDDFTAQIRDGEPFASGVMFFPMHRVERLELDLPEGNLPSLAQRFAQRTGQDPAPILVSEFLPPPNEDEIRNAADAAERKENAKEYPSPKRPAGDSTR
jgi:hypothetical protein